MNRLPITFICVIIGALGLTRCDYRTQYRQIPFAVQQYFTMLPNWKKPKKVQIDWQNRKVYWLNQNGEIHAVLANGTQQELINKGIGAILGITYIDDFALNSQGNAIYFTDLMDVASGLSAIKRSDLKGEHIQTLVTFPAETPYAVSWDDATQQLYYLTKREKAADYSLQLLGEAIPLAITDHKVTDIPSLLSRLSEAQVAAQPIANQSTEMF